MNQEIQQQRAIERQIHKRKTYVAVMGFEQSGKTSFIECLTCHQIPHESEFKVIKYGKYHSKYYDKDLHNCLSIQKIKIPSLFHQKFQKEISKKLRIIDIPAVTLDNFAATMKQINQIVQDNPLIIVWVLDYQHIDDQLEKCKQLKQQDKFLILNKIDLRTMQDQELGSIFKKQCNMYKLSSKNIFSFQIMNHGTEEQKNQFMKNYFLQYSSLLKLNTDNLTKHCQKNIKENKYLVDQDYMTMMTHLEQLISQQSAMKLYQQLNLDIQADKQKLILVCITLIQQEQNKEVQKIQNQDNGIDFKDIQNYFLNQVSDISKIIKKVTDINIEYYTKIQQEIECHVLGRKSIYDDELEVVDCPEVEDQKNIINGVFKNLLQSQQSKFNFLNKQQFKLFSNFISSYQAEIDSFNSYLQGYLAGKTIFTSKIVACKQLLLPMMAIELGEQITISPIIIALSEAAKLQMDTFFDDKCKVNFINIKTFTKNYKLLTDKFQNDNITQFNELANQIKSLI